MNAPATAVAAAAVTAPAIALRDVRNVHGEGVGAVVALGPVTVVVLFGEGRVRPSCSVIAACRGRPRERRDKGMRDVAIVEIADAAGVIVTAR
jgi:hypothetical protein